MEMNQIYELMDKFDESKSSYLELTMDNVSLKLKKADMAKKVISSYAPAQMPGTPELPQAVVAPQMTADRKEVAESTPFATPSVSEDDYIKAPLVGVFYAAASPDKPAYVSEGSRVNKGDVVCLIEAMKMMNEVVAHKSGVIKKVLVKNEDMVEYDTPLFIIQE